MWSGIKALVNEKVSILPLNHIWVYYYSGYPDYQRKTVCKYGFMACRHICKKLLKTERGRE